MMAAIVEFYRFRLSEQRRGTTGFMVCLPGWQMAQVFHPDFRDGSGIRQTEIARQSIFQPGTKCPGVVPNWGSTGDDSRAEYCGNIM